MRMHECLRPNHRIRRIPRRPGWFPMVRAHPYAMGGIRVRLLILQVLANILVGIVFPTFYQSGSHGIA